MVGSLLYFWWSKLNQLWEADGWAARLNNAVASFLMTQVWKFTRSPVSSAMKTSGVEVESRSAVRVRDGSTRVSCCNLIDLLSKTLHERLHTAWPCYVSFRNANTICGNESHKNDPWSRAKAKAKRAQVVRLLMNRLQNPTVLNVMYP